MAEPTLNRVSRQGLSEEVTPELSPEDRRHLNAGPNGSAKALGNKLRLFGVQQTEGPVCLEYREREGGWEKTSKRALKG